MFRVILNGTHYDNIEQIHEFLKDKLKLLDYYGENLNALWDCLTTWVDLPLTIEVQEFNLLRKKLGNDASEFIQLLKEAEDEVKGFNLEIK